MPNQFLHDLSDTWSSAATTFDGIKLNIADAASAADSKLINLQVGRETRFSVDKAGALVATSVTLLNDLAVQHGGTGASSAAAARENLGAIGEAGLTEAVGTRIAKAGDRMTGALSSAVKAHGVIANATEEFKFADANTHSVTCDGNFTINPTGLAEGDVMQINVLYRSGTITVSGATLWELGGAEKTASFANLGVVLRANTPYRIILEIVAGARMGAFQ